MIEPLEKKAERVLGPLATRLERKVSIRAQAVLIFACAALWWSCLLFIPESPASGAREICRMAVAVLCPVASLLFAGALLVSASKAGWPDRLWIFTAIMCAFSPWAYLFSHR
jgi:hypothetical protein